MLGVPNRLCTLAIRLISILSCHFQLLSYFKAPDLLLFRRNSLSHSLFLHLFHLGWTIFVLLSPSVCVSHFSVFSHILLCYLLFPVSVIPLHFHTSAPPAGLCLSQSPCSPSFFALFHSFALKSPRWGILNYYWHYPWKWLLTFAVCLKVCWSHALTSAVTFLLVRMFMRVWEWICKVLISCAVHDGLLLSVSPKKKKSLFLCLPLLHLSINSPASLPRSL